MMISTLIAGGDDDDDDGWVPVGWELYSRRCRFCVLSLVLCGFLGVPLCVIHFLLVVMKMYIISLMVSRRWTA